MALNSDPICVFCKGYANNCGHMEPANLVELAKKGWFNDSQSVFLPFPTIDREKVNSLIDEIEAEACSCDPMMGYSCGTHAKIRQLREEINNPTKVSVN